MNEKFGIFSPKLKDLMSAYSSLAGHINSCQSASPAELREELNSLAAECTERERQLKAGMNARTQIAARLNEIQLHYECELRCLLQSELEDAGGEARAECMTLAAEFAMDLAASSMRHALVSVIAALLSQQGEAKNQVNK